MGQLNLTADQIKVVNVQEMEWPDGCLGVVHMGMMCTQQIVPGFLVILEANGVQYEFHTNQDGSLVVPADGKTPVVAPDSPDQGRQRGAGQGAEPGPDRYQVRERAACRMAG